MEEQIYYKGRNVVGAFMNVPIFVGTFVIVTDFAIVESMDAYRDKEMGDVILGKPFHDVANLEVKRFEGLITLKNGEESLTYQMPRMHPRIKHIATKTCNKMDPILLVDEKDKLNGIKYNHDKWKNYYKGILDLGPEYKRDEKVIERLTRGHVSMHAME